MRFLEEHLVHQTQFPETPLVRTMSATRLGVSVEKVVATIEVPSSHQGIFRPERKNDSAFPPARRLTMMPMAREAIRKALIIPQSIPFSCIAFPCGGVKVRGWRIVAVKIAPPLWYSPPAWGGVSAVENNWLRSVILATH